MEPIIFDRLAANESKHWWFVARRKILADTIHRRIGGRGDLRILEAGCGTGGNLEMLSKFGKVSAFEPDEMAVKFATNRGVAEVKRGHLPGGIPFSGPFDLIALLDVIEHLDDDLASLKSLAALLAPDGRFLIAVPAYRFLWSHHDELHHHKRRYSSGELRALAREAKLEVEFCSHFNTFLFPALLARRIIARMRPDILGADDEMPGAFLNQVLTAIFEIERFPLRWCPLPFGASLLMIARRAT